MPSSKPLYPGPYDGREKTYYFTISGKAVTEVVISAESLTEAYEKLMDREWDYKDIKEATLDRVEEVEECAN